MRHKDLVVNDWAAEVQRRAAILLADAPDEGGSYRFTTDAHEVDDCPFLNGDAVSMVVGQWGDLTVPDAEVP